jgi:GNAT superfamily N-acetyltransferase
MTLLIRPATRDDVSIVLHFVRELAAFEREPDAVEATEEVLARALFDEGAAEAVIAERDGQPVGFALFFHNFSTWTGRKGLYLEDLYITPEARGSGVGRALLSHLAALAVARDCARFEWAVLDWNQPAIDFYTAQGATMQADWRIERVAGKALARLAGRE